jgi:hypothetical protein
MENIVDFLNLSMPKYETTLPFSEKKVTFSPFKVKDAKNIAIILQENNKKLALKAMVDLLKTYCSDFDPSECCLADGEYLFLQIRSKSVDEVLNLIRDNEKIQVNIGDIKPRNNFKSQIIDLGHGIILYLNTPTIKQLLKLPTLDKEDISKACIEKITVQNEVYHTNKFMTEEIKNIIDNLPMSVIPKFDKFLKEQPELYITLPFQSGEKEVTGLLNFFIFR